MRAYKLTPELAAKIEKRKRIINIVLASCIAGHAYHTYGIVQLSKHHKEQRALSEERFELLTKKFNDQNWIDGLQNKLGSLKDTRQHVNSVHFSAEEIQDMEAKGFDQKVIELTKSKGSII
mmetsp:Transcript_25060/g.42350  ORF Transcript_25060/g.42350 Transcript_25060/m.42350 type:complete len:121 (-) Transcript_25060:188-550(-)